MRAYACFIVGFAKIHRAAYLRMHFCAAEFFGRDPLSDRRLHQRGTRQKQA